MIYLDNGATSLHKPKGVYSAVMDAMKKCANPGRGGHRPAMEAAQRVYRCRELASEMFDCEPEQVVFTANCTHGLNIAVRSLCKPGSRVVITGFEHNAVVRPLAAMGAKLQIAGRRLFDPAHTLQQWEEALKNGADAAIFTHCSNVYGYILPVVEMAALCRAYAVPFAVDAAQAAGTLPVKLKALGAGFIAMPGHKGLLGPQGSGMLLCAQPAEPLLFGGTGSSSADRHMPQELPERLEAGTLNVPAIAGLYEGLSYLKKTGVENILKREQLAAAEAAKGLKKLGYRVFAGAEQSGTVSFVPDMDCEEMAGRLAQRGIAVRAGLHCAPLAHESGGTAKTGTVRLSFGHDACFFQVQQLLKALAEISGANRGKSKEKTQDLNNIPPFFF